MNKLKVMTVVGTRPEIIRLSAVLHKLEACEVMEHTLVHTGQNYDYELNEIFFRELDIKKPAYYLNAAAGNAAATIGTILIKIDPVLEEVKPDALLILGDTNSCLCAIAAKKRHIPIFHMEAGNRCFDQRVPEEANRKIADHIADINLPYSSISRDYLLREGLSPDRIIKTGSPMYEVIHNKLDCIEESDVLNRLGLKEKEYFIVSAHREENIASSSNFYDLIESLNAVADRYQYPVILSTHPRTREMLLQKSVALHPGIVVQKPFGFIDYLKLQLHAKAVLSDSGTISEEASILGLRALNLRQTHERPEAMEEAAVMMVGLKKERILQGLHLLETQSEDNFPIVSDYDKANVSDKVLRIILSYTDYVNHVVWKQQLS